MGKPMVLNLLKAGHKVTVFDRRKEAVSDVCRSGANEASSIVETARSGEVIFTSLPNPQVVEEVTLGEGGLLEALPSGATLIVTDTVLPKTIKKIAARAAFRGVDMLESPISGGVSGAYAATLTFIAGGDKSVFERCRHLLQILGKNVFHVGVFGAANTIKLVNNLISIVNVVTVVEGFVLGMKAGADPKKMFDVISSSTGRSYALEWKLANIIAKRNFDPGATIELVCKDLSLAKELGKELAVPLFMTSVAFEVYEMARAKGLSLRDHTSVATILEDLAGVEIKF